MANTSSLDLLRDVHVPPALGWWPVAPGWYILIILILIAITISLTLFIRYYQQGRFKRQSLRLLARYHQQYTHDANPHQTCAQISELLKQAALIYYPRQHVAGLQGDAWLNFLNAHAKNIDFNCVRTLLLERPFQNNHQIIPYTDDLEPLFECTKSWIKQQGKPCLN